MKLETNKSYFEETSVHPDDRAKCSRFLGRVDDKPFLHLPKGKAVRLVTRERWVRHDGDVAEFSAGDVVRLVSRGTPEDFSVIELCRKAMATD